MNEAYIHIHYMFFGVTFVGLILFLITSIFESLKMRKEINSLKNQIMRLANVTLIAVDSLKDDVEKDKGMGTK